MEYVYHVSLNAKHVAIIVVVIHVFRDIIDKPPIVFFANHLVQLVPHFIRAQHVLVDIIRIL